jgi:Flp pilus assembly protein TadG
MRNSADFIRDCAGNVATLMGVALVPLCLGAGVAIDMARINGVQTVLQGAADAAALAGGTSKDKSDGELQKIVEAYLKANHAEEVLEYVTEIKQELKMSTGSFTVTINGEMNTSLMALAGMKEVNVGAQATVNVGAQALELALVLDNTGSMAGSKIANLKAAATNLVNILETEMSSYADVRIGLVPFAEYVNIGPGRQSAVWVDDSALTGPFAGCVGSRNAPLDEQEGFLGLAYPALSGEPCNTEILPLTDNFNTVRSRIAGMGSAGNTYIPAGVMWGWNLLTKAEPFTEARSDADLAKVNGRRAIVIMTDGENTISPSYPAHNNTSRPTANLKLETLCGGVKGDKIEVYTVSFMVPSDDIKDILVECASKPGNYFDADNSAQLYAAFADIARQLAAVRLTN